MEELEEQIARFEKGDNLSSSIEHAQRAIDLLTHARNKIAAGMSRSLCRPG